VPAAKAAGTHAFGAAGIGPSATSRFRVGSIRALNPSVYIPTETAIEKNVMRFQAVFIATLAKFSFEVTQVLTPYPFSLDSATLW
jgi:hypothetical protein